MFLGTRDPLRTLRDNFQQNRVNLTADWERVVIGRISLSLKELGSIPLHSRPRDLAKRLDRVGRMVDRMTDYEYCPSLLTERVLLSAYRYMFMAPHDRRFSALCPNGIREMLRQNGVPPESLYYQDYGSPLQGRETVIYKFASGGKGQQYLRLLEHVRLDAGPGEYGMLPARRPNGPKDPSVPQGTEEAVPLSEKMGKNRRNIAREKGMTQNTKVRNTKAKNKGIRM